ncbi:MAG: hypothetical protein ABSD75_17035 [Terriglobales bacterium]
MSMNLGFNVLSSERRISVVMALAFLPWIAVVLFTAGGWAALNFLGYAIVAIAAGYCIVSVALARSLRSQNLVLAPATGVLLISAVTVFWVRLGLPLIWVMALWLLLVAIGGMFLWKDRGCWMKSTVAYGGALALLSALICLVYFLPSARNDAVLRPDGSFNWLYVDTQYNYSIAAAIKSGGSPPKEPGTATEELLYHFGGYAPAAAISRFDGLALGDAYARVTRGASLWALMLSCFGVGTLLSLKATGEKFGGIMSVAGLFFYGSLLALFTDERNSSSYVNGAILFRLPEVGVGHDGGPFSHLVLGHSELHALTAITAIMGLCLLHREWGSVSWRSLILVALPACAVPMHSVAALYCLGVVGSLLFWARLRSVRSWLLIILMFCLFFGAWKVMGYSRAPDASRALIKIELRDQWGTIATAFMIGLGLRIVGFRWISRPLKDPVSALVLATILGMMMFFLLVHFKFGEEIYGIFFLQSMFSIFAFSRLTSGWWHGIARSQWIEEWLRLTKNGTILIATCWVLIGGVGYLTQGHAGISFFRTKILLSFALFALLAGTYTLMKRSPRFATIGSAVVMSVLLIGFFAWIPPVFNFGLGRMKMDVTLTPGEVQGLNRLDQLAAPGERFATNRHELDSLATNRQRSYSYAALSERPVLLEGLQYHTPAQLPWFQALVRDNDLIFSTSDPETVRDIAKTWGVRWLVARPGTDLALPRPLPAWLVEQQNSATLRIYRID